MPWCFTCKKNVSLVTAEGEEGLTRHEKERKNHRSGKVYSIVIHGKKGKCSECGQKLNLFVKGPETPAAPHVSEEEV